MRIKGEWRREGRREEEKSGERERKETRFYLHIPYN